MKIIDIRTVEVIDVPDDYICCSICGVYHPKSEYMKDNETTQSRTNCSSCYKTDIEKWEEIKTNVENTKKTRKYQTVKRELDDKLQYFGNSISVQEMIDYLLELAPTDRIFIGQEGYYAEGKFADIFKPEFKKSYDNVHFYEIGYSSQNY